MNETVDTMKSGWKENQHEVMIGMPVEDEKY